MTSAAASFLLQKEALSQEEERGPWAPAGRLLQVSGGSPALLRGPRFLGRPGGAWRGPSSGAGLLWLHQPFPSPDGLCPQCHYVPSEQSRSEALPHRAWLHPSPAHWCPVPAAGSLLGSESKHPMGSLRSAVAHRTTAGAGRAAIPTGALEGHKDVCQLLLELLGHSAGAWPYSCPLSQVWTDCNPASEDNPSF